MTKAISSWPRFLSLLFVLLVALGLLHARNRDEIVPPHTSLSDFPLSIGNWEGTNLPIDADTRELLGPGDFMSRDYFDFSQSQLVNLFIVFFPSQRQGDTIHSPKNCLPGAGWLPVDSRRIQIEADGRRIEVNRYLVQNENRKAMVLYWYQAHGRVTPSGYMAKYYLVADAIRMNRSDGSLVRVTTLVQPGETNSVAQDRAVRFAQELLPLLDRYIPR
jgi:EpsI family protein